ncbi:DUF1801 domain-containing protein [Luteimonas aquatica]|uniref:DUF1801 domain-containing protein n=1 Tax=Luteimonas aquatica TaxID=450364 RepID=UPI001F58F404|nr:DUF1801 domain-containing protein [Luteimonas aquatica]
MATQKTMPGAASVSAFIAAIADPGRRADAEAVAAMMREATGCAPKLWGSGIVGFDQYHYRYENGREGDWPVVGFAPRKQALALYLASDLAPYEPLLQKLGKHSTGKGCLYVKRLADIDTATLKTLIGTAVAAIRKQYPADA